MYSHPQQGVGHDIQALRRQGGAWLRELREKCGYTQRQFAALVGIKYYTFIAQIECGRGRIPPDRYERWAYILQMQTSEFVKNIMKYYDPESYRLLFGDSEKNNVVAFPACEK